MKLTIEVIIYILTDTQGNHSTSIVDDYGDSICFGGIGNDGQYHQYDSYEGIHSYSWAEKLGMKVDCQTRKIEIDV